MKRHILTAILVVLTSGFVVAQQQPAPPAATQDEHHHLSKKEKKELKKVRDEERKADKHRLKREAEEHKKADKESAKQRKHEREAEKKEMAKKRDEEHKRDRKAEEKEIAKERHEDRKQEEKERKEASRGGDHPSMVGRTASAATSVATAPFRLAMHATPSLLRAQRDVGRAIYSQMPASNVAVLLSDAGQIVLRGSAPSPSLRSRLLELAMGAAGGYPIVDQLVSEFAGDVASAAAGKVSDMIHGNPDDNGSYRQRVSNAVPQSASGSPAPSEPGAANTTAFDGGSRACASVANNNRVILTGQTTSQANAEMLRQFALQLGGVSAALDDQLVTRSNGASGTGSLPPSAPANATVALTPGSTVCVNMSAGNDVLLTGTVASPTELSIVERAAQPLAAGARLSDQLTIGTLPPNPSVAEMGGVSGAAVSTATSAAAANAPAVAGTVEGSVAANTGVPSVEGELEQALHSVPRLANVDVQLTGDTVRLSGTVDTTQDEQTARDITRQYAPGRSIVDNLTVAGRSPAPGH